MRLHKRYMYITCKRDIRNESGKMVFLVAEEVKE